MPPRMAASGPCPASPGAAREHVAYGVDGVLVRGEPAQERQYSRLSTLMKVPLNTVRVMVRKTDPHVACSSVRARPATTRPSEPDRRGDQQAEHHHLCERGGIAHPEDGEGQG